MNIFRAVYSGLNFHSPLHQPRNCCKTRFTTNSDPRISQFRKLCIWQLLSPPPPPSQVLYNLASIYCSPLLSLNVFIPIYYTDSRTSLWTRHYTSSIINTIKCQLKRPINSWAASLYLVFTSCRFTNHLFFRFAFLSLFRTKLKIFLFIVFPLLSSLFYYVSIQLINAASDFCQLSQKSQYTTIHEGIRRQGF